MTPDQLTALAQRLRGHAATLAPNATREDMIEAARYLLECAEAEPVATVRVHNTGGNSGIAWSGVPTEHAGTMRGGTLLYTHPQPPSAQYPLPDDLYPGSKDWVAADYRGRVEWLHTMYESKKRDADLAWSQVGNQLDAVEALRDLLPLAEAFTRKAVFTAQRAGELASILDRARAVLAAQGGNNV